MATTDKTKGSVTGHLQRLFSAKESKAANEDAPAQSGQEEVKDAPEDLKKSPCCNNCLKVVFVLLSFITLLESIAEIVVTVSTAIFTKLYGSEQSGRLVAMIILALLAAVAISMLVNALVAVFRHQSRPLHAAAVVLFVVAALQAVVLGVAVRVTSQDELQLIKSLQQSFLLSVDNNPRHSTLWATTQYEMSCCGINSPEDYRSSNLPEFFAPNVPISCCPAYDPNRSELVQEREREFCKSRKTFYREGCQGLVVEGFKTSSHLVHGVTIVLIIVEIILSVISAILAHKIKRLKCQATELEKAQSSVP